VIMKHVSTFILSGALSSLFVSHAFAQHYMENLGRSPVAIRNGADSVFISWRRLGTDPADIRFNLYRDNALMITTSLTNYVDATAGHGTYQVKPVLDGKECEGSPLVGIWDKPYASIPLKEMESAHRVHLAWVGDLNGDGQYDCVADRLPTSGGDPKLQAYLSDGTFLWEVDMGPNSYTQSGWNDNPPASISGFGNIALFRDNDNVTVFDLNSDGKAEVLVRTADGVTFGDGTTLKSPDPNVQFISVIDGLTGEEITRAMLPTDYLSDGPLSGHMGAAYLDGVHPSLIYECQNRKDPPPKVHYNMWVLAYDFDGESLSLRWTWDMNREEEAQVIFHQMRILDVDGDGKDEICPGGFVVDHDGTMLYSLNKYGVVHGDRFHITDMDPDRDGLEGFGIQQAEGGQVDEFAWFYFDAATGEMIRHSGDPQDVGRGTVGDVDPAHRGYEMWSSARGDAGGLFDVKGRKISPRVPAVNFKLWWDGDLLSESLDRTTISKWNPAVHREVTLLDAGQYGAVHSWRNAPVFHGDIMGDWREEVIFENGNRRELMIFTTTIPSDHSLYTLVHNPGYRTSMTCRGYLQSNLVDYYLGDGMDTPKPPDIQYP